MPKLEGFTHPVNIITSFLSNHLQKLSGYLSLDCSGGPTDWTLPSVDPRRQHSPPTGPSKFSSSAFTPVPGPPLYNMNMTNGSGDNLRAWINHFGLLFCWAFFTPLPLSLPHFYFITERDEFLLYAATGSAPQRRQRNIHLWHTYTGYSRTGLWLWWWRKSLCSKYWWWWYELSEMDVIKRVPWYNRAFCMDSWTSCCFLDLSGGSVLLFNRWPSDCLASTT